MEFWQDTAGDEFCIAGEFTEAEKNDICETIWRTLDQANRAMDRGYQIGMCMGCAKLTEDIRTIPDFINKADQELYIQKSKKTVFKKAV